MENRDMDEGLEGNRKLEEQIRMLQTEPSQEMLAVVLTSLRRRMKDHGQMIVPVDSASDQPKVQIMQLENGERWLAVFTSFDEQLKGGGKVMSTFLTDIGQLLRMTLQEESVEGLLINPWNRSIRLGKDLIRVVLGDS